MSDGIERLTDLGMTVECDNCGSENIDAQVICAVCGREVRDV
jgi:DNA-directed RNA polymerase subunit RPC12/RpoP